MRVLTLLGTRPEVIKLGPVIEALTQTPDIEAINVATGQHRELSEPFLELFGIEVHRDLGVMRPGQTL